MVQAMRMSLPVTRALVVAAGMGLPVIPAGAESQLVVGPGNASARVNFVIVIPRVLYLGIGAGGEKALQPSQPDVTTVGFDLGSRPDAVGAGRSAAGPAVAVPVAVYGNQGPVSIRVDHPHNLVSAQGVIAFSQIAVHSSDATNLPAPSFQGTPTVGTTLSHPRARITSRRATWTYSYENASTPAPGRYEGQAIYTATMP